ncbi:MAG: hypothetical protein KGI53_09800 [Nitrospirota bacterium]|nr:hypothetical protein [Nitrospirota bacterium]
MKKTKQIFEQLLDGMPFPPNGVYGAVHRSVWADPVTKQPLGVVLLWAYGPVSAFLAADGVAGTLYDGLPPAAQTLVDDGEDLLGAARSEAQAAKQLARASER